MSHPIHEANANSPYGNLTKEEFYKKHHIFHQQTFMLNQQNMKIFTQSWQPQDPTRKLKGLVGMIHGYTAESSWIFELNAIAIAKAGFFVCALDLQGHGYSEGSSHHVTDIQPLVSDSLQYFDAARADHPMLPPFLYGESLGGAIAILLCLHQKSTWKGLILSGPMCEISQKFKPIWPLELLLPPTAFIAPRWRIAVTSPAWIRSFKEKWKREMVTKTPNRRSCGKPTAGTALELLKVCDYVKTNCHELEVPLLILHGGDDVICDPEGSRFLYESAGSKDKKLKIFPDAWHQLIGESNESADEVLGIILSWIEARADLSNIALETKIV